MTNSKTLSKILRARDKVAEAIWRAEAAHAGQKRRVPWGDKDVSPVMRAKYLVLAEAAINAILPGDQ